MELSPATPFPSLSLLRRVTCLGRMHTELLLIELLWFGFLGLGVQLLGMS